MLPIYHFHMPNQYLLTSTFLRFAESYESPEFKGKGFTLEEFQDWYASRGEGVFTYYEDWVGFNFPSYVVEDFTPSKFGVLSRKEHWVLDQLKDAEGVYYVIASAAGLPAIEHELVHALFYIHLDYARKVESIISEYKFTALRSALVKLGYTESVIVDEINAYLVTGLVKDLYRKSAREVLDATPRLIALARETFGFDVNEPADVLSFLQRQVHHIDGASVYSPGQPRSSESPIDCGSVS